MTAGQDPAAARAIEVAGDRVESLTVEQRLRVLWRITVRHPDMVTDVVGEFETSAWEWGR